jgi:uncharacterized glyoxalase superfamily protein PhnB
MASSSKARSKTKTKAKTATKVKAKTAAKKKTPARKAAAPAKGSASKGLALLSAAPSFTVDDVAKSLAWYRDVMGFTVGKRWENKGELMGVELSAGPVTFMIGQDDWSKGRHRTKGAGFRIYCDTTQDVDRIAEGIKARGGTLAEEPRNQEWGARSFSVQDPDGFKITISKER